MSSAFGRSGGINFSRGQIVRSAVLTGALALASCSSSEREERQQPSAAWQPTRVERGVPLPTVPGQPPAGQPTFTAGGQVPMKPGAYKVGKPYVINGVTYVPAEDPGYDKVGMASWYGDDFHARKTANGEYFDMARLTAAHPTLPLPSYVHVTNLRNGRSMIVRVNDRGPYKPGRIIDLSRQSAKLLGFEGQGTTEIRVRFAGPAPLDPSDDRRERQFLASQPWNQMASRASAPRGWFGLGMGGGVAN